MSSIKNGLRAIVALGAMTAMASTAQAQASCDAAGTPPAAVTCNLTNTASASAPSLLRLTLSSATADLGTISSAAYDATVAASSADGWHSSVGAGSVTLEVRANRTWTLEIDSPTATWATAPAGHAGKAVGDLAWSLGTTSFTQLSTTPATLDAATSGTLSRLASAATPNDLTVSYRTAWRYDTDIAGDYAVVVRYTLTAN